MKTQDQISKEMHAIALQASTETIKPYIAILQPRRTFKEIPVQRLDASVNRMLDCTSMSVSFHAIDGNPVDVAENWLIQKAIDDNVKYAFFAEEDTAIPFYGLMNLLQTSDKYPDAIIVGVYYVKFGGPMMGCSDEDGRWRYLDVTPNTGVRRDIRFSGLGCALIPMSCVRKIQERFPDIPLFCVVPEGCWGDDKIRAIGNDTWFYHLAHECGIEVIADTSVQCLHVELATGKYAAHPDVDLDDYVTNFPITDRLTYKDRKRVEHDYHSRINKPEWADGCNDE